MSKKIFRAGFIPYYFPEGTEQPEMLFMVPNNVKHGGDKPQLAKGKIEEGESNKEAAIREAKEEVGLFTGNIKGEVIYLGKFLGRTEVYIAEIEDKKLFGEPSNANGGKGEIKVETKRTVWLTKEQFIKEGRLIHVPIIKAANRKIKNNKEGKK